MSYQEFLEKYYNEVLPNKPSFIRKGQSLINFLGDVWMEEYKRISSIHYYDETNIDCFYRDDLIPNTLAHLEKIWVNFPN